MVFTQRGHLVDRKRKNIVKCFRNHTHFRYKSRCCQKDSLMKQMWYIQNRPKKSPRKLCDEVTQLPEACSSTLLSLLQTKQMASWRISQRKGKKKSELDLHILSHLMPVTSRNGPQKHGIPIQEIFKLTGLPVHLLCLKKKLFQLRTYAY